MHSYVSSKTSDVFVAQVQCSDSEEFVDITCSRSSAEDAALDINLHCSGRETRVIRRRTTVDECVVDEHGVVRSPPVPPAPVPEDAVVVVDQIRIGAVGPWRVVLIRGDEACCESETLGLEVYKLVYIKHWPIQREVPVLGFKLRPWETGIIMMDMGWFIKTDQGQVQLILGAYAPAPEPVGTAYTKAELEDTWLHKVAK